MKLSHILFIGICVTLFLICSCSEKTKNIQPEGSLEIVPEPDPLLVSDEPANYVVTITAKETGGVGVDFERVTVVLTFLDDTHIMLGQEDLTETMFTWIATCPEEGGPVKDILAEFWHLDPNEEKTSEILVKIGSDFSAPEGFEGFYLPVFYIQMTTAQGKSGFKVNMTYEAIDTYENQFAGSVSLRLQIQEE